MHILAPHAADVRYLPSQNPDSKKDNFNFGILLDGKPICIDGRVPTNVYTMQRSTDNFGGAKDIDLGVASGDNYHSWVSDADLLAMARQDPNQFVSGFIEVVTNFRASMEGLTTPESAVLLGLPDELEAIRLQPKVTVTVGEGPRSAAQPPPTPPATGSGEGSRPAAFAIPVIPRAPRITECQQPNVVPTD